MVKYTCIDSFCGAGGLGLGLQQAGFDIRLSFDKLRHRACGRKLRLAGGKKEEHAWACIRRSRCPAAQPSAGLSRAPAQHRFRWSCCW